MNSPFETAPAASAIPIYFVTKSNWVGISKELPPQAQQFAKANDFAAKSGKCLTLPSPDGQIAQVLFGLEEETSRSRDLFRPGALPGLLPPGVYRFANAPHDTRLATLAFALGSYRFGRYRKAERPDVRLVPPDGVDIADIAAHAAQRCNHRIDRGARIFCRVLVAGKAFFLVVEDQVRAMGLRHLNQRHA